METNLRRQDDEMIYDLEKRFDAHLQIYANNGREMARLAVAVETMAERSNRRDEKVNEMFEFYKGMKLGKKGLVILFAIFMGVGSAILLVKNIMK